MQYCIDQLFCPHIFPGLQWKNPQFYVTLEQPDSILGHGDDCTMIVALMQKVENKKSLAIGFQVFRVRPDMSHIELSVRNFKFYIKLDHFIIGNKYLFVWIILFFPSSRFCVKNSSKLRPPQKNLTVILSYNTSIVKLAWRMNCGCMTLEEFFLTKISVFLFYINFLKIQRSSIERIFCNMQNQWWRVFLISFHAVAGKIYHSRTLLCHLL